MPLLQGIIDFEAAPPLTRLSVSTTIPTPLDNPFTGAATLNPFDAGIPAYGIAWAVIDFPAGAGARIRAQTVFEIPFLDLALEYTLADAHVLFGGNLTTGLDNDVLMFTNGTPTAVAYNIAPGWVVNFYWLIA